MIKIWRISISITTIFLAVLAFPVTSQTQVGNLFTFSRVGFNLPDSSFINVTGDASIDGGALQLTPDSINRHFSLFNKSGRAMYKSPFKIWENSTESKVISFNSTFDINVFPAPSRVPGSSIPGPSIPGEGLAFVIAPNIQTPPGSDGGFLGLTNRSMDKNPLNKFVAIEIDTVKEDYDPNGNHMGLNINTVQSIKTVNLADYNISTIAPQEGKNYTIWIQYNGTAKLLDVYIALQHKPRPVNPLISETVDLMEYVNQESYFGFSASTGSTAQLNCILGWNLTVETFPESKDRKWLVYLLAIGIPGVVVLVICLVGLWYYWYKLRVVDDPKLLGALKSLPGTPREFSFKDLKKATSNFDEKMKLGQGGFGVVYKGVLPNENTEVAVKKFSRESIKSKVDFLAELTIINRLRHKHLVKLNGWCHKNGMLLIVYEYMPNGSLDNHLFGETEKILSWNHRSKIIYGVVSGLHYLHNEYEQKVIHRDLKSNNIMLDLEYNARLGDFGLARAIDNEKTSFAELEGIPGTLGYIAPECFHTGKATRESDVFGFGAVVLEVVCGERPWTKIEGFNCLVDWVWKLYREGRILEAVDQRLGNDYVIGEAEKLLLLGLACSHPIASERPKTQVIFQIISGSAPVPMIPPFKPSFVWPSMEPGNEESTMSNTNSQDETPVTSSYYGDSNSGWTPKSESRESYVRFKSDKKLLVA